MCNGCKNGTCEKQLCCLIANLKSYVEENDTSLPGNASVAVTGIVEIPSGAIASGCFASATRSVTAVTGIITISFDVTDAAICPGMCGCKAQTTGTLTFTPVREPNGCHKWTIAGSDYCGVADSITSFRLC